MISVENYTIQALREREPRNDDTQRIVVILVATLGSLMILFLFVMICVVRRCRQQRKFPETAPLKKRVVVMRSNILYADSWKENSQVRMT